MFVPTSPLILRRGARRRKRQAERTPSGQSQTEADNNNSILPIPFEEGLNVNDEPIITDGSENGEQLFVQSTIFQSNSWSLRNESIRNKSIIRRSGFFARRRKTKQSITGRNTSGNKSRHSSKRVSEAVHGNESDADDYVDLDPSALRNKYVLVDRSIMSGGGGASTSDNSESRKVLVIEDEGKGQTRFVRVFTPFFFFGM